QGLGSAQTYIRHTNSLRNYLCSESVDEQNLNQLGLATVNSSNAVSSVSAQSVETSPAIYTFVRQNRDPDEGKGNCENRINHVNRHSAFIVHKDPSNPDNSIVAQINGPVCNSGIVFSRVVDLKRHALGANDM